MGNFCTGFHPELVRNRRYFIMSYIVIWGYKTGLMNKKFIGIKPCDCCHRFSEQYLSKSFFRINLFWFIPIFGVPTGKYLRCTKCDGVVKLTRDQWRELKEKARYMPKKKQYLQAYEELKALVLVAQPEDLTVSTIYNRLLGKLDFTDDGGHIRELVEVYLENSQNVANMLGKTDDAQPATATDASLVAVSAPEAPAETPVADNVTRSAESAPTAITPAPAATVTPYPAADETAPKRSKARLLWLIPALLLLPIAAILAIAGLSVIFEDPSDIVFNIFMFLLFVGLPVGLDVLFFSLAFKKKK